MTTVNNKWMSDLTKYHNAPRRLALISFVCISLAGCTASANKESENKQAATQESSGKLPISRKMLEAAQLDTVRYQKVAGVFTVNGKVTADDSKLIQVFPTLTGYATQVRVQLGDYVKKGQLLAVVHSGEIATYENQLSDARSNLLVAQKKLKVEKDLKNSQLATDKDVADAQSEVSKAQAAITQVENLFQIYKKGQGSTYEIQAPISGYIIQKNINNGMEITSDNNQSLFTISEINDVWVVANIFETDIPKVKEGYEADITSISYPDSVFHGRIDKVYNFLDPVSKTMQARIKIDNNHGLLKPEMFASVKIHYPGTDSLIAIPSSAIIFDNNTHYVLVRGGRDSLTVREVLPTTTTGDQTYIKTGLQAGEAIVTKDQLLLYNALLQ
jgi:cobalt-zinc-cadmium efflux system membrane fusion protein